MKACKPGGRVYTRRVTQQLPGDGGGQARVTASGRHRRTPATGALQQWRREWGKEWGKVGTAVGKAIREGRV